MSTNKEEQKIIILQSNLKFLRRNLLWPTFGNDLHPERSFFAKYVVMMVVMTVVTVSSTLHLTMAIRNHSPTFISEDLVFLMAAIGGYYFITCFIVYQLDIAHIYADLSDFSEYGQPPEFQWRNKQLEKFSVFNRWCVDAAIFSMTLSPLFTQCKDEGWGEVCGVFITTWLPVTLTKWQMIVLYAVQVAAFVAALKPAPVISHCITASLYHLIVRVHHLGDLFEEAVKGEDWGKLIRCVRYHSRILDVGQRMDHYYAACLFLHIIITGLFIGCMGFRLSDSFSLNVIGLALAWLPSVYMVCIAGQKIIDETQRIADRLYNTGWYDRDAKFQQMILFVIMRAQRPVAIHAGPLTYVSHALILAILKSAYTYMTLLRVTRS